jgi:cyclophilin family peptidyl-prolyl cis-trans isomerase
MNAIITALDSIKSPRSIQFLETQLNSPYLVIQQKVQHALIHITDNQNVEIPEIAPAYTTKWDFDLPEYSTNPNIKIQTSKGDITLELFPDKAPVTVANFLSLIQDDFYDSVYFHRVIPGFVIQGGDPRGDGWGGPGYSIPCEYNDTFFNRGILGMAHAGKDTGGSQFFITQLPQPHLNGRYTAFGKVINGMDVVDQIMPYDYIIKCDLISFK